MEQKAEYKSVQNFALFAISIGVLLVLAGLVGGANIFVAIGDGILIHTLVIRFFFSFLIPLVGGIVLIFSGLRLLNVDRMTLQRSIVAKTRRRVMQQKEHIISAFLTNDEKKVIALIKERNDGALQSDLVIRTGYSKVKIHRILKGLENRGIIKRGRFGITNKVLLSS